MVNLCSGTSGWWVSLRCTSGWWVSLRCTSGWVIPLSCFTSGWVIPLSCFTSGLGIPPVVPQGLVFLPLYLRVWYSPLLLYLRVWYSLPALPQGWVYLLLTVGLFLPPSHRWVFPPSFPQLPFRKQAGIARKPATESTLAQGVIELYTPASLLEKRESNPDHHPFHCGW